MDVYRKLVDIPPITASVVTIGTFDGLHIGHQAVITELTSLAEREGIPSVVVTFDRHPRHIISTRNATKRPEIILSNTFKLELLEQAGVEKTVVLNFDEEMSMVSAEAFLKQYIIEPLHPSIIVIGYDNRFGHNREGDVDFLKKFSAQFDYTVRAMAEVNSQADEVVSSTRIRELIRSGRCEEASLILGRPYAFGAKIVPGDGRGSDLGFPTANLELSELDQLIPSTGVYVVSAQINGQFHFGMTNVGVRPTFGGGQLIIEVHLFDFEYKELYGEMIKVAIHHRLRDEKKFETIEALVAQLAVDREQSLKWIEENKKGVAKYAPNN